MADETVITWDAIRKTIGMMGRRWGPGTKDEWSVRPSVVVFSLAIADELEAKNRQAPKLLPESDCGLAFIWEEGESRRYMFFAEDYLEETVLANRKWHEISYAESSRPV